MNAERQISRQISEEKTQKRKSSLLFRLRRLVAKFFEDPGITSQSKGGRFRPDTNKPSNYFRYQCYCYMWSTLRPISP